MLYVIVITAVLALAGLGLVWFLRRERERHRGPMRVSPPPVVFMPHHAPDAAEIVRPGAAGARGTPMAASGARAPAPATSFAPPPHPSPLPEPQPLAPTGPQLVETAVPRTVIVGADAGQDEPGRAEPLVTDGRPARPPRRRRGAARLAEETEVLPVPLSATGTLRMLPGRFEVVDGHPADCEIRFVAEPGVADQRFTMGRGEGLPGQHVRLQGRTVSRLHASLAYDHGGWTIENLSATNPLRINGRELDAAHPASLADGDIVELGEVVLRFRT